MNANSKQVANGNKGRSCGYKGGSSRKSKDRFYNSEDFMVNCFKVLPCFKKYRHDWWVCPYAHEGETAKRRDPKKFKYVGVACPDAKQGKACPRGDDCPCTHNVFEYWLHPTRFRTAFCGRGIHCTRPFCFFAHSLNEMRKPSLDDLLVVIQGDSLFNGDMLKRALEEHKKDVERLGGKDTDTDLLDMSFLQTPQGEMDLMKEVSSTVGVPSSPSPRELLQSAHSPSPRGHRGPMPRTVHHSPMRSMSPYRSHHSHEAYHNPMSDPYMHSPRDLRDLSPGHNMSKGRPRVNVPSTADMLPDMQSPREVLGFMNTVLMNASPRDLSPENLRFVQSLRDEAAALMTGTPSPRDLSPQARHSAMDVYNYQSPRGMSPPIHHTSPHSMRPVAPHRDASPSHGVDEALLEAMNAFGDMKTDDEHMSPMYRTSSHRNSFHASSASPRNASWHNGEMAELMTNAVQMERDQAPRGRAAGAYDGGKTQNDVREILAEMQRSQSGSGQGLSAQMMKNHATMPLSNGHLNGYRDGLHSTVSQDMQEAILRESMRASFDESTNYRDMRQVTPDSHHSTHVAPVADDSSVFPQSLQAVLRSLSKEEHGYNQEEETSAASRPFSSLSGLW